MAQQPDPYVGPGQVAWFQFTIRAPETPGIYRLYIRPLIEGATWLEDFGVYWQVTVLNLDGSPPAAYIPMPDRVVIESSGDVSAQDISDVRSGAALASVFVRETFGTDVRAAIIRVRAGGTAYDSYGHLLTACCQADARGGIAYFDVTDPNWSGTTWTPRASHLKNVAHEYTHVWQASSGNRGCLVGETGYLSPRWFLEGLAEYVGYSVVLREGLVSDPGIDRRRRGARANLIVLRSLEGSDWPSAGDTYGESRLAVELLAQSSGIPALGQFCRRVGDGDAWQVAFQNVFAMTPTAFYQRFDAWLLAP